MKKYICIQNIYLNKISLYFCAMLGFFQYLIMLGIAYVLNRFGIRNSPIPYYLYFFLYFFSFFFFVFTRKYWKKPKTFLVYFAFILAYLIYGLIISPKSFQTIVGGFDYFEFLFFFPTLFIVFLEIDDYGKIEDYLTFAARILAVLSVLIFLVNFLRRGGSGVYDYDMVLGYQSALIVILLLSSTLKKINFYDMSMAIILSVMITAMGSRGALLTILVFLLSMVAKKFFFNNNLQKKIIFLFSIILLTVLSLLFFDDIANLLYTTLKSFNIESRTLEKFLTNSITDSTGRNTLFSTVIDSWNNMPIFGYGLIGDRQFLDGLYVHNVFLEMITSFGFIIGPMLIIVLITSFIKALQNQNANRLIISISSYIIVALMLSGSYITSVEFFSLIALVFGSLNRSTHKGAGKDENRMVSE